LITFQTFTVAIGKAVGDGIGVSVVEASEAIEPAASPRGHLGLVGLGWSLAAWPTIGPCCALVSEVNAGSPDCEDVQRLRRILHVARDAADLSSIGRTGLGPISS
jgi:hypothetical protein